MISAREVALIVVKESKEYAAYGNRHANADSLYGSVRTCVDLGGRRVLIKANEQIILKVREVFNDYLPDHFHVDLVVIVDQHVPEAFYGLPVH